MSHFTVMVIGDDPETQLEPYDENIEVDKYDTGEVSEDDKERFINYYTKEKNVSGDFDTLYKQFGNEWNYNEYEKVDGVWKRFSTYSPNSKWDWYSLGGRWSGLIKLKDGAEGVTGESGVFDNETGIDQAKKGDIANLDELKTYAVVKNGEWYEQGKMGWFGMSSNDKDDELWKNEIKTLLSDVSDDTLISIFDCHI